MINTLIREPVKLVVFKLPMSKWKKLQKLANKHTGGNVSEWLRYKAMQDEKVK